METLRGTQENSTFFVVARNKELRMGLRIFLQPFQIAESLWIALMFRVRVEGTDFKVPIEMAKNNFGDFPFYESKSHCSCIGALPLVALPCSPSEVYMHLHSFNGKVEENLVDLLLEKMSTSSAKLVMSREEMILVLQEQLQDKIPEISPVTNPESTFLLISVGEDS
jgi:hypothetical protein